MDNQGTTIQTLHGVHTGLDNILRVKLDILVRSIVDQVSNNPDMDEYSPTTIANTIEEVLQEYQHDQHLHDIIVIRVVQLRTLRGKGEEQQS